MPHLFITIAFHQLDDVHMSNECEDFAHKGASGKRTSPANQLIIIPQMGPKSSATSGSQCEGGAGDRRWGHVQIGRRRRGLIRTKNLSSKHT